MYHLLDLYMSSELFGCFLQQQSFPVHLQRADHYLANIWVVQGFTWDIFGHYFHQKQPSPGTGNKRQSAGTLSPHYLQTSLRSPLYILRYFPCIKFPHTHPQIFLNSSWISLHSLNLIFPLIRHLILSLSKIPSSLTKSTQQVLLSQHGISHVLI